jgi:hypothetical protein
MDCHNQANSEHMQKRTKMKSKQVLTNSSRVESLGDLFIVLSSIISTRTKYEKYFIAIRKGIDHV